MSRFLISEEQSLSTTSNVQFASVLADTLGTNKYTFPTALGEVNQVLKSDGSKIVWGSGAGGGSGDVSSNISSTTADSVPRFSGTSGKTITNSKVFINASANIQIDKGSATEWSLPNQRAAAVGHVLTQQAGGIAAWEAPTGGNSFDQSLNTTDAVVFASVQTPAIKISGTDVMTISATQINAKQDMRMEKSSVYSLIATPSNPSGGNIKVYAKADSNLYKKDVSGTESRLGDVSYATGQPPTIDGMIPVYDGSTGKLIKNSGVSINNNNDMILPDNTEIKTSDGTFELKSDLDINIATPGGFQIDANNLTISTPTNSISLQAGSIVSLSATNQVILNTGVSERVAVDDNRTNIKNTLRVGVSPNFYDMPSVRGTDQQILRTNGSGAVSFTSEYVRTTDWTSAANQVPVYGGTNGQEIVPSFLKIDETMVKWSNNSNINESFNNLNIEANAGDIYLKPDLQARVIINGKDSHVFTENLHVQTATDPGHNVIRDNSLFTVDNGTFLYSASYQGQGPSQYVGADVAIRAEEAWSNTGAGSSYRISTTKIGQTLPQARLTIDGQGDVIPISLKLQQTTTPSNPSANFNKIYTKSDDHLYTLSSAGVESKIQREISNNVVSGGSSVVNAVPLWDNTSGTLLKNSTLTYDGTDVKQNGNKIPVNAAATALERIPYYNSSGNLTSSANLTYSINKLTTGRLRAEFGSVSDPAVQIEDATLGFYKNDTNDLRACVDGANLLAVKKIDVAPVITTPIDPMETQYDATSGCWGVRKLRSAYAGNCMAVIDSLGITAQIGFDANGVVDYSVYSTLTPPVFITTLYDQSPNARHLTGEALPMIGGQRPSLVYESTPYGIKASIFFRQSRFVSVATSSTFGLANPNHFTTFTFRTGAFYATQGIMLLSNTTTTNNSELYLNTAASFGLRAVDDAVEPADVGNLYEFSSGNWHTVAGGSTLSGFQRAAVRTENAVSLGISTSTQTPLAVPIVIGSRNTGSTAFTFNGYMTQFAIFPNNWATNSPTWDAYHANANAYAASGIGATVEIVNVLGRFDIAEGASRYSLPVDNQTAVNGGVQSYNTSTQSMEWRNELTVLPGSVSVNNDFIYRVDHFELYTANNTTATAITANDVPTRCNFGSVILSHGVNFTAELSGANVGRITYTGSRMRMAHMGCTMTCIPSVNNTQIRFYMYLNGALLPASVVRMFCANSTDYQSTAIHVMTNLEAGDYLELYCQANKNSVNITISECNIFGMCMSNFMMM